MDECQHDNTYYWGFSVTQAGLAVNRYLCPDCGYEIAEPAGFVENHDGEYKDYPVATDDSEA